MNNKDLRFNQVETLIVKVTHRCNLDCLYCYENVSKQGEDMSLDTFKQLAKKVIVGSQSQQITFLFHGGEPTLLPNAWYQSAIAHAQKLAKQNGKRIKLLMQSNLLGLNKAKIELLQRYKIQVGASIDTHPNMEKSWRGGDAKVWQNIQRLREAKVRVGLLSTINASNFRQFGEICRWLGDEEGFRQFKANVVTPVGRGVNTYPLPADLVFEAQHDILEYLIRTKGRKLHESNLSREIKRFFEENRGTSLCHEQTCGAGKKVLGITPKGDLLPCGRFQWDDENYFLGELQVSDLHDEVQSFEDKLRRFHEAVPENWYDCDSCAARKICGFGCQAFILRSRTQANVDCLPTKMRYDFFVKHQKYLKPVYEEILKRSQPQKFIKKPRRKFWRV